MMLSAGIDKGGSLLLSPSPENERSLQKSFEFIIFRCGMFFLYVVLVARSVFLLENASFVECFNFLVPLIQRRNMLGIHTIYFYSLSSYTTSTSRDEKFIFPARLG
jgi:hypothetical protein